jgi:hypothetical protein
MDNKCVSQKRPLLQHVLHLIFSDSGSIFLGSDSVDPALVGAAELDIDKLLRWVPALNLALPGEGNPKQMEAVLDARPLTEVNGVRRHHLEAELWRGNALEIAGLSKECKHLITWEWQTHGGGERV